jgi:hypothetical protein
MSVARARRPIQPVPIREVLSAERCAHGAVVGMCALCRAAELAGDQDTPVAPEPVAPEPVTPRAPRQRRPKPEPPPVQLPLPGVDDDPGPAARSDR